MKDPQGQFSILKGQINALQQSTLSFTCWLCFASHSFLDVHHIMRHSTLDAFEDLRMSGLRIQKTIEEFFQLSKTYPQPKTWPEEGDEQIQLIEKTVLLLIIQDVFQNIRASDKLKRMSHVPEKHTLLSQHAILCGSIVFSLNSRIQIIGRNSLIIGVTSSSWPSCTT